MILKFITFAFRSSLILNILGFGTAFITAWLANNVWFGLASILALFASFGAAVYFVSLNTNEAEHTRLLTISSFLLMMIAVVGGFWVSYEYLFMKQGKIMKQADIHNIKLYAGEYTFFEFTDYQLDTTRIAFRHKKTQSKNSSPSYTDYFAVPLVKYQGDKTDLVWLGLNYNSSSAESAWKKNRQEFIIDIKEKYTLFVKHTADSYFREAIENQIGSSRIDEILVVHGTLSFESLVQKKWDFLLNTIKIINLLWLIVLIIDGVYISIKKAA
jgi:translation initiation factor IF-1